MQDRNELRAFGLCLLAVAVLTMSMASGAWAQEPLRWKFEKGAKFDYDMVQDMTIGSTGGPGGQNVTMHQEMKMTWDVQDVNQEGDAVIEQKIDRVKMKMALPAPVGRSNTIRLRKNRRLVPRPCWLRCTRR